MARSLSSSSASIATACGHSLQAVMQLLYVTRFGASCRRRMSCRVWSQPLQGHISNVKGNRPSRAGQFLGSEQGQGIESVPNDAQAVPSNQRIHPRSCRKLRASSWPLPKAWEHAAITVLKLMTVGFTSEAIYMCVYVCIHIHIRHVYVYI